MSKHTPGPWIYYADLPSQDPDWHIVTTENRLRVVANVHIEPGNKVDEANARLIAAATELLDACEACLARDDIADDELGVMLRAATAKARGAA